MKIISKQEAKKQGLKFYYTGKPCKHGHYSKRQTSSSNCMECLREWKRNNPDRIKQINNKSNQKNIKKVQQRKKNYYEKNRNYILDYMKNYYKENKEHIKERVRKWTEDNREYVREYRRIWRYQNENYIKKRNQEYYQNNKEKILTRNKEYRETNKNFISLKDKIYYIENKSYCDSRKAKKRADKIKATPLWSETNEIKIFYEGKPEGYEVDHIIPLNGINVCGLHCLDNLQYITPKENEKKNNKLLEEYAYYKGTPPKGPHYN